MLSEDARRGLNVALNESRLLSVQVDRSARTATVRLEVLTLPEAGTPPQDAEVALVLHGLARVAASLRHESRWDDEDAAAVPLTLDQLDMVVRQFGGSSIYGWEFVDPPERSWRTWLRRLSLDEVLSTDPAHHTLELFQEAPAPGRHLDLRLWFDDLTVADREGRRIELDDFVAGGARWWQALFEGDPRTAGHGIVPMRKVGDAPQGPASAGLGGALRLVRGAVDTFRRALRSDRDRRT